MNRHLTSVAGLAALALVPATVRAQSPWETGAYQNYVSSQPAKQPSGLEGAFGPPSTTEAQPATQEPPATVQSATPAPMRAATVEPAQSDLAARFGLPSRTAGSELAGVEDAAFIMNALQSFKTLIAASQIIADKSTRSDMRDLAGKMDSFVQPLSDALKQAVSSDGKVDVAEDMLHRQYLSQLSGDDLDGKYITLAQSMLNTLGYEFEKEGRQGHNEPVKALAKANAGALRQQAEALKPYQTTTSSGASAQTR